MDSNLVTLPVCNIPVTSSPPTMVKTFSPDTISAGGTSTLTINLTAPLIDTLPSGLVVLTPVPNPKSPPSPYENPTFVLVGSSGTRFAGRR